MTALFIHSGISVSGGLVYIVEHLPVAGCFIVSGISDSGFLE